jgi:hypothetical protein
MHKSYSGAGKLHGTAVSRGQSPEAAAKRSMVRLDLVESRDDETRGRAQGKTARGSETPKSVVTREAEESCEGKCQTHERRREKRPAKLR